MPTAQEKAIADLQKTLKREPTDTRALLRLAELLAKTSQAALACETYSRAGDVFVAQGFARRALSAFAQALEVARGNALVDRVVPISRALAKLYTHEKLPREAVSTMDASIRFLIEKGADADAVRLLEERIALDDTEIARVRLAEAFFRMNQPARAASQLQGVFARLQAQNRRDEALDVAERLLGERCDVAIARASAEMYLARNRQGDAFLALARLRVVCSKDATHVPTLQLLARAFDQAGHAAKAGRVRVEIALLEKQGRKVELREVNVGRASDPSLASRVDAGWEIEVDAPSSSRLDPSRASFWPDESGTSPDASGSVVSVQASEVELFEELEIDEDEAQDPPVSVFEAALECIESLAAQGRSAEALAFIAQQLTLRPHNPLLLERKLEIEEMAAGPQAGPPAALYGFPRSAGTAPRAANG